MSDVMRMNNLIQFTVGFIAVLISATGAVEVEYAQVGDTVILRNTAIDSSKHYVNWYFNSVGSSELASINPYGRQSITAVEQWKNRLTVSDKSLTIKDFQQNFFGTFICDVKSGISHVSTVEYKVIKYNVSMTPASPRLTGELLTLACNLDISQGQKVHWLTPTGDKRFDRELKLKVTTNDNGQWSCVVNEDKNQKGSVSVTVLDLSPVPSRLYTSPNVSLTVPCSFPSHISWDQIKQRGIEEVQWLFSPKSSSSHISSQELYNVSLKDMKWIKKQNRRLMPVPGLEKGNLSLSRNRGNAEDEGMYTCLMKFKDDGVLSRIVEVKVLQIISSQGTEFISGQQVNLSCTTGEPLPTDMQLKWFPPEKSPLPIPDHHLGLLTLQVGTGHSGKWKCELWRDNVTLTSAVITLKIEPKLSAWMLVLICSAAVILLLLIALAVILNRRRQRKQRRPRYCQCKNPKGFYKT